MSASVSGRPVPLPPAPRRRRHAASPLASRLPVSPRHRGRSPTTTCLAAEHQRRDPMGFLTVAPPLAIVHPGDGRATLPCTSCQEHGRQRPRVELRHRKGGHEPSRRVLRRRRVTRGGGAAASFVHERYAPARSSHRPTQSAMVPSRRHRRFTRGLRRGHRVLSPVSSVLWIVRMFCRSRGVSRSSV